MKSVDLISIISELWSTSSFCIIKEHMYEHQDNLGRPLTQLEKLNCRVDNLAKEIAGYKMDNLMHNLQFSRTTLGIGTIICNNILITSNIQQSLYKQITHKKLLQALATNPEVPLNLEGVKIDWEALSKARKGVPYAMQLFITKWLSGDTAT